MIKCRRVFCAVCAGIVFFSCGSSPKIETSLENHVEASYSPDPGEAVAIAVPQKERTFFSGVETDVLSAVENGSPESIRYAYSILRKKTELSDAEKVLLGIGSALFGILWKSETANFSISDVPNSNPYIAAIESAKQGIYDTSTGNKDFLSLVLPSLVLVVSETRNDYFEQSAAALDSALELNGESVLANYLRGVLAKKMSQYESAIAHFSKSLQYSPENIEIIFALAECSFEIKDYQKSLELAQKIVEKNPVHTGALKLCAQASFQLEKIDESELYVARVLQQEPENARYVLFRAKILIYKKDYIRAASLLDVFARTDPNDKEYLILRTQVQKDWNKNAAAAAATVEKALTLYPDSMELVLMASSIASETGGRINGKTAGELAEIILKTDSKNVFALEVQIKELVQTQQWEKAYRTSNILCSLENAPQSAVFTHILICLEYGKKDEALQKITPLYSRNPNDETVVQYYIRVLIAVGQKSEAAALIAKLLPDSSSKMKSFLFYERSFLAADTDSSLADLRSSLTANPRNKDALFRLYEIYFSKKEYRKAHYYLKQVVSLSPADEKLMKLNSQLESLLAQ